MASPQCLRSKLVPGEGVCSRMQPMTLGQREQVPVQRHALGSVLEMHAEGSVTVGEGVLQIIKTVRSNNNSST